MADGEAAVAGVGARGDHGGDGGAVCGEVEVGECAAAHAIDADERVGHHEQGELVFVAGLLFEDVAGDADRWVETCPRARGAGFVLGVAPLEVVRRSHVVASICELQHVHPADARLAHLWHSNAARGHRVHARHH